MSALPDAPSYRNGASAEAEGYALRLDLQSRLMRLSFHGLEACLTDLLRNMGYADVQMLQRTAWRQRTGHGGLDLQAHSDVGVTRAYVILQLKQYVRPVSRRFVDELRGTMLRTGAQHGLLVTTSTFSRAARRAATGDHFAKVAPIRLIDGDELLDMLLQYRIGIWEECVHDQESAEGDGSPPLRYGIDDGYFKELQERYPGSPGTREKGMSSSVPVWDMAPSAARNKQIGGTMTWRTHVLGGTASLWALSLLPDQLTPDTAASMAVSAALGSLLPDLDAADSKLTSLSVGGIRPFTLPSGIANRLFGHRGLLHSLLGLALAAAAAWLAAFALHLPTVAAAALALGYASHLILDGCTVSGIPVFYPNPRRVHLLPKRLRVSTGTAVEDIVLALLVLPAMLLLLRQMALLGPLI